MSMSVEEWLRHNEPTRCPPAGSAELRAMRRQVPRDYKCGDDWANQYTPPNGQKKIRKLTSLDYLRAVAAGHDTSERLGNALGRAQQSANRQLARLAREGWLTFRQQKYGKTHVRVYSLTEAGQRRIR